MVDQVQVVVVDQVQVVEEGEVVPLAQLDLRLDEALVQPLLLLPLPLPLPLQQLQEEEQEQEVTMECQRSSNDSTISPSSTAPCHPPPVTVA